MKLGIGSPSSPVEPDDYSEGDHNTFDEKTQARHTVENDPGMGASEMSSHGEEGIVGVDA
jgi:hypothetical protein